MASAVASAENTPSLENAAFEEEEAVDETHIAIDELQKLGISASDIKKVKEAGICTAGSVLKCHKKFLLAIKGLSDAKVDKMVECAKKLCPKNASGTWQTATEVKEIREKNVFRLTTGSESFDALLGGGIETSSITEVFGEFRTGKTQLCHTLAVVSQLPRSDGGGSGRCAYIDTEGTFRPERIKQIAERFNLDPEAVLENIVTARLSASDQFEDALAYLAALMCEQGPYRVVIVDSVMALFRVDYEGRGELSERQWKVGELMSKLKKLAEEFNCAVIVTNQVMADPSGMVLPGADNRKAIGGHVLAHAVTTRIYLKKGKAENRIAKLQFSPTQAEGDATFSIGEGGVQAGKD